MKATVSKAKQQALDRQMQKLGVSEKDIEEKFVRAGGRGGQKINKTSVSVHLKHKPTGIQVKSAQSRVRAVNRFLARRRLVDKLKSRLSKEKSDKQKKIEKIRRQKRKRSKRAKEKMLKDKAQRSRVKKERSWIPAQEDLG